MNISENTNTLEPGAEQYYANVDFEEYSQVQPKEYMPNGFEAGKNSSKLPADMFDLSYQPTITHPFRKSGFEFDLINIPPEDSYGVKTAMSEKEYLLVGNESLQKSVDQINSTKTQDDIEISEILIKEQQQLKRRQKMMKMFGEDVLEADSVKNKNKTAAAKPKTEVNKISEDAKNKAMPIPDAITQDKPPATQPEMQSSSTIPVASKDNKTPDNNSKDASGKAAVEVTKNKN